MPVDLDASVRRAARATFRDSSDTEKEVCDRGLYSTTELLRKTTVFLSPVARGVSMSLGTYHAFSTSPFC